MNRLTLCLVFLFGMSAWAQKAEVHYFQVANAHFAEAHVASAAKALLTVDYSSSQVLLQIVPAMPICPKGQVCAQVMPNPILVGLPITDVQRDNCGIRHVRAERDFRPNGGIYSRIELTDAAENICTPGDAPRSQAVYETRSLNRAINQEESALSTMDLVPIQVLFSALQREVLTMSQGSFTKGFSPFLKPVSGTLILGSDKIEMTVQESMECTRSICPRLMPQPLHVELPLIKVEKTECGIVMTAQKDVMRTEGYLEEITVTENQSCDLNSEPTLEVHYHAAYAARQDHDEYLADFTFARSGSGK